VSIFETAFAEQVVDDLLSEFGETVLYRPNGKRPRSISAIVKRHPPEPLEGAERARSSRIEVTVKNDYLEGIASDEIDIGKDQIDLSRRVNDTVETLSLARLIRHDAAVIVFEVR